MMLRFNKIFLGIYVIFIWMSFLTPESAYSQIEKEETNKRMENGYKYMIAGNYKLADDEFRYVLDNAPSLPPDICYYFGLNSYYMGKHKQSINWLNKYIELKGTGGQFFKNSEKYLKLAEEAFRRENNDKVPVRDSIQNKFSGESGSFAVNEVVDCERVGKIVCPVCKGKGVIIKEGLFGKEYNTCPYGDDYGYMSCTDYNLLMQGKLEPQKKD